MFRLLIIIMLAGCCARPPAQTSAIPQKSSAGVMLGKSFWWKTNTLIYDTLGWSEVERKLMPDTSNLKSPIAACALLAKNGKTIYRLKNLSAMSLIILRDLGYRVALSTQWTALSQNQIKVAVSGASNDYMQQDVRTDYLWETIDTFAIQKPTETVTDYTVELSFADGGMVQYFGKEDVLSSSREITGIADGLVIEYSGQRSAEALKVRRKIWDAFLIVDAKKKDSAIITDIETVMDKMKLDMSYPVAKLVSITCK
jgi:hypothetical protein